MSGGPHRSGANARFEVVALPGLPEVRAGDDLVGLIGRVAAASLADGDIVVVTSKIVSKAEGRTRTGVDRDEAIDAELVRIVSEWTTAHGRARIGQTRHGLVLAAGGVDTSNVEPGQVILLPVDPDASARRLRDGLRERYGVRVGVVISDTAGRPWREGQVDIAIGAAGVRVIEDLRGRRDRYGNRLDVTAVAVADELAAATELVRGKLAASPVAVVRGLAHLLLDPPTPDPGATGLVRSPEHDRFRLGTPEAMRAAVHARARPARFADRPVDPDLLRTAVAAALSAPVPGRPDPAADPPPLRFLVAASPAAVDAVAARLPDAAIEPNPATAAAFVVPCSADRSDGALLGLGAAVENLLIVAGVDGVAGSWLPPGPDTAAAAAALDPPAGWHPVGLVALGWPDDGPRSPVAESVAPGVSAANVSAVTVTR